MTSQSVTYVSFYLRQTLKSEHLTSLSGTTYEIYEPGQRETKTRTADLHHIDDVRLLNTRLLFEFLNHFTKFNLACSK
jgi:hypothetical protein